MKEIKKKNNIYNFFLISCALISLLILNSCLSQNKILQERNYNKRIESFEGATNKYCTSLGLDFSKSNPIRSEMFFRCKIELAKRAKINNPLKPEEIIFNGDLKKYIEIQDHKYMNSIENLNYYRNSLVDNIHHKICKKRGYTMESLKQEEIEDYLNCREILIMSFEIKPAYRDEKDLNYRQSSYNIDYIVNKKQDKEIRKKNEFSKEYPFCASFKVKSPRALECKNSYDEKRACLEMVRKESFARKKKFYEICQQKLYIKLPDSLLIEKDKKRTKTQERNYNTDLYLNQSYYQFLSDEKMKKSFMATNNEENKSSKKDQKKKNDINNSFDGLYTKDQLTSLRQRFIQSCTSEVYPKVANFVNSGNKVCNTMTLKWEKKVKKQ